MRDYDRFGSEADGRDSPRVCRFGNLLSWPDRPLSAKSGRKPKANVRLKIEYISAGVPCYLLARQLDEGSFCVSESSTLGGVRIRSSLAQPRTLTRDGLQDLTIFAFQLCVASDRRVLETDSIVELRSA